MSKRRLFRRPRSLLLAVAAIALPLTGQLAVTEPAAAFVSSNWGCTFSTLDHQLHFSVSGAGGLPSSITWGASVFEFFPQTGHLVEVLMLAEKLNPATGQYYTEGLVSLGVARGFGSFGDTYVFNPSDVGTYRRTVGVNDLDDFNTLVCVTPTLTMVVDP